MTLSKFFPMKKWWTLQLVTVDPRVSHGAVALFSRLVSHHNNKTGQCNPSQETLAKALDCSTRSIRDFTDELREAGYVKTRRGRETRSRLHYTIAWFEGTAGEFYKAEKSCQNQRKQSSGKHKKEQKKKKLRNDTKDVDSKQLAGLSASKTKEETQSLLETLIVKQLGATDQAWIVAMEISPEDYSLEVDKIIASKTTMAQAAKSLIMRNRDPKS